MKALWIIGLALALGLGLGLAPGGALAAGQLPSCDDLDHMAGALDKLAEALEQTGEIAPGSELDQTLAELINALADVANIEKNPDLIDGVNGMGEAWKAQDWESLQAELDAVVASLDQLIQRDCG